MKKIATIAAAIGLTASIAATASADEVTGTATPATATSSTYGNTMMEPVITPEDIKPATPMIILTRITPFYFTNGSVMKAAGMLSPQTIDTTGQVVTDMSGNEWREVYTWLGLAWIKVPNSAFVIMP
ncbi:hypothetical protein [Paenibacillus rhizophilus]|uniref:SH3 domain-containing protein n=1 Tax=Paenibacillus rhizophilus TaxID=1850366 RepID=A0A3N9P003_9BACL|nr:hypothetical protein [Paenibacillus rhizophilus]RQW09518.1 hypothetical protein EH198_18760 [Paenibacillus rhizophilus]